MMKNRTSISACPQIVPTIPCINYSASLNLLDVLLSPILQTNPPGIFYMQFKVMLKGPPFNVLQVSTCSYRLFSKPIPLESSICSLRSCLRDHLLTSCKSRRALIAYSPNQSPWNLLYAVYSHA